VGVVAGTIVVGGRRALRTADLRVIAAAGTRGRERRPAGTAITTDILPQIQVPFTPPKPIAPTPDDLRGSTVLVVDDERAWRVILETDLRMLGYKVSMAEDADQALERAQSDQPEVAIIDLMLPEPMDGWGLLNELRARGQKVPVIFYTAYPVFPSGTDDPDVVGYMSKAVDRADLYALLPPAIRRSRERRSPES
jgi:two-component system OmpR family response regulator